MTHHLVRLEFTNAFEMLDLVQYVSDHVAQRGGLDPDALHWVGLAVRESVINAATHGNRDDATKHVVVEFETIPAAVPELSIRVRDEGQGFDPEAAANPLSPENMLKASGRGIFLIRSFMDDVRLQRAAEGGMEIRMIKRVSSKKEAAQRRERDAIESENGGDCERSAPSNPTDRRQRFSG